MAQLAQVTPGALREFVDGEISAQYPYIWSYILAGSFPVIGNALGEDPIVAFYNPYFDLALLTHWRFADAAESAAGYKLMRAVPVTGRAFIENRAPLATDEQVGSDAPTAIEVRIVNAAQAFVASFEERYAPFGQLSTFPVVGTSAKRTAISIAENRVFYLLQWVSAARDPDAPVNYAAAIAALQGALSAATPGPLEGLLPADNPQSAALLFSLDADIRAGMKPYLVIDKNVIFIDPVNLQTGFISAYFQPAGQSHVPALVMLVDLAASLPAN